MFSVQVKLGGKLEKYRKLVSEGTPTTLRRVFDSWNRIFGAFIRGRFVRASRGDGTWRRLAPSTIARRRKGRATGAAAILRDTNLLFLNLVPTLSGAMAVENDAPKFSATFKFGGDTVYPDGDGVTTSDVASFHQEGGPNLPQRKIIVPPDEITRQKMAEAAKRIIVEETR